MFTCSDNRHIMDYYQQRCEELIVGTNRNSEKKAMNKSHIEVMKLIKAGVIRT
jgi:hypothetical protein